MSARAAILLRPAEARDFPRLQAIYAHHVTTGLASFEESPPDLREMLRRWDALRRRDFPYLVAVIESPGGPRQAGYAYAAPHRSRSAYRHTVEDSIYLDPFFAGQGIGKRLLARLIEDCERLGKRQMIAVIGHSGNEGSIRLHLSLGFRMIGTFSAVGFKFGRWVDTVLMQRALGTGAGTPPGN